MEHFGELKRTVGALIATATTTELLAAPGAGYRWNVIKVTFNAGTMTAATLAVGEDDCTMGTDNISLYLTAAGNGQNLFDYNPCVAANKAINAVSTGTISAFVKVEAVLQKV